MKTLKWLLLILVVGLAGVYFFKKPAIAPVSTTYPNTEAKMNTASDPLGGYDVLIADKGNNRLLEVSPDKKIVWEYDFNLPKPGLGADDSFFTDASAKQIIVNLEDYHIIQVIDYAAKKVVWQYGQPGQAGSKPGYLNTPDDAYMLPSGNITVADIKNCRVIEISPDKKIVRQYGKTGACGDQTGELNSPNGDTPIAGGHMLISNIRSRDVVELDQGWNKVFNMKLPVAYPSDPQLTRAGNILISDFSKPGKIVEVDRSGQTVWEYQGENGVDLNHPSLAIELPNGNILSNDDDNSRVIVIDKTTKKIVWQYGVTGQSGRSLGLLSDPDGVDIVLRSATPEQQTGTSLPSPQTIGSVSRHATNYLNKNIRLNGYMLKNYGSYAIFSDEQGGTVGYFDLPVIGPGLAGLNNSTKYILEGTLKKSGLSTANHNPYYLDLASTPQVQ